MRDLICYVSAMGNGPNRDAIIDAGLRMLINPLDPREVGPNGHCLDNTAWVAFVRWLAGKKADPLPYLDEFEVALDRYGPTADFVVLPDIVAGGLESLALSLRWMNRCLGTSNLVLIAVQDGMEPEDLEPYVGSKVGIFLGGSTEWKLARAEDWGRWCAARPCVHPLSTPEEPRTGCWYHYARVNTERRFRRAHVAGADSVDGSSAAKFPSTLPLVSRAAVASPQADLFHPRRLAEIERGA